MQALDVERQKRIVEEDWAQKMAGAEQDKIERIAQLDQMMAAREAEAQKYLAETKVRSP